MAGPSSWPWLEWVTSWDTALVLDDVCDQLHVSARHDFLLLMWRHAHEYHTRTFLRSMAPHGTLPAQVLPTIDSFLQRYGFRIWPDSNAGYNNRYHLQSVSRYSIRGYYDVQLETWSARQPFMSLHGTMRTIFYDAEHGLAFSKLGKILQVYFMAMLQQDPDELSQLAATHGSANQALQAVLHHNTIRAFQHAGPSQVTHQPDRFPTIQQGSRSFIHQQGYPMGQALASQAYYSPAFATISWSELHDQHHPLVRQTRHASPRRPSHTQRGYTAQGACDHVQNQYPAEHQNHPVPVLQPAPTAWTHRRRAKQERAAAKVGLALRVVSDGGGNGSTKELEQ